LQQNGAAEAVIEQSLGWSKIGPGLGQ
jgi:hypothetical protein